jgi:tetratricopeptide (TPR) repeat protein
MAAKMALAPTTVVLAGALILCSQTTLAQEGADLGNLILEPVLRSAALDAPIDLGNSAAVDSQGLTNSVEEHLAEIERLRRARRSSNPELIEQLGFLAVAYQGLGRHREALDALDEAISATIKDGGRDNLEQIPLQEQKIPSYLALDDIGSVDDTEERVYDLYQENYGAAGRQMYFATINLADWNTTAYFRENYRPGTPLLRRQMAVINRAPRSIGAGAGSTSDTEPDTDLAPRSSGSIGSLFNGSVRDVFDQDINDPRLRKIDRLYASYQNALAEGGNAPVDILIDMAKRIARLAFITKQEMDYERDNYAYGANYEGSREQAARNSSDRLDESYDSGIEALKYALNIFRSVEGVRPEALAATLLDLADWHLAYGKAAAAEEAYSDVRQVLLDAGFSPANIDRALAADMPIQIPVFATHVYSRNSRGINADVKLDFDGYVDVAYTVDRLGNASDVAILGRSTDDSSRIEKQIEIQLKSAKFRPTLAGGQLGSPGRVEARYYYSY